MNQENKKSFLSSLGTDQDIGLVEIALNASISGIIITDNRQLDNPIIYCNEAFENITGYSRNEIIGHNCRFLQANDRTQSARDVLKKAIKKGESCVVEIRNYKKNGDLFWNELYMSPVKNRNGETTHFIGVQNEITRRKKAEQEVLKERAKMEIRIEQRTRDLRESEEYLNSIFQTVRESLIVLDPSLKVLSVNECFLKTFKVSSEETEGQHLYDLGNGQWDIADLRTLLEEILPTNNPVVDFEVEHEFPHIGRKLMLLNAYRIELEGEFKDRILMAIEDITEQREIERRKDDFLSIASHELKTPLTTIKGFVQMMNRFMPVDSSEKFREIVGKTALHVSRLNDLIGELLDVSKIQAGHIALHREAFNFDDMIHNTIEGVQAGTKSHTISIKGTANSKVVGDESHIVQVLNNLLSNAIKYSPDSKEIIVYLSKVSNYIKVSITDQGMGITLEDQKRVFDRFYRVGSIQKKFPGMGIGLYICQQIINEHKGTIWVESEKGKGATFSFTLPINEEVNDGN